MPDTTTPNYSLIKPEVGGSIDTWGGKTNGNWDILDTRVKGVETTSGNALQRSSLDVKERTAKDYLFYDTDVAIQPPLNPNDQAANCLTTNGAVRALMNVLLPVGTIVMWVGSAAQVPSGWALCDGRVVNGHQTPNLIDRFVVGGGSAIPVGTYGGNASISFSGTTGGTVLSWNEMPVHAHGASQGTHAHNVMWNRISTGYGAAVGSPYYAGDLARYTDNGLNTDPAAAGPIAIGNAGGNWAHVHPFAFYVPWQSYWPQFYAICFIMRVLPF